MFTGEDIRKKRKQLGLSVDELADLLKVNKDNLYKWEKGIKPSRPEDYLAIENWLNKILESVPRETGKHSNNDNMEPLEDLTGAKPGYSDKYIKLLEETVKEKKDQLKELQVRLDELAGRQADFLSKIEGSIERYEHLVLAQIQAMGQPESGSTPTVLQQIYKNQDISRKKGT